MALPRNRVRDNVRNLSTPIIKHLIKIILYGKEEHQTLHHWCHELNNWLEQCMDNKIKSNKKSRYPSEAELYQWLTEYYDSYGEIERMRSGIEKEFVYHGHIRRTFTDEQVYNNYAEVLKKLCVLVVADENTVDAVQQEIEPYILA